MADDLPARLRSLRILDEVGSNNPLGREAADEIERLRNALHEMLTNGRWTEGEQRGEWAILPEVYEIGANAEIG